MRSIYFLLTTLFITFGFTSCMNTDDVLLNNSDSFESIKTRYGAEEMSYSTSRECSAISISTDDMLTVLETLQKNGTKAKECSVESQNGGYFGTNGESTKKVIMSGQYQALTRTGGLLGDFALCVELNFSIDNNQIYYLGTDYLYNSDLFEWKANGLSLTPAKNSNGYTYEFESESFLYFMINDRGNCTVKVPIIFKGQYDFKSNKGSYNFKLENN